MPEMKNDARLNFRINSELKKTIEDAAAANKVSRCPPWSLRSRSVKSGARAWGILAH